MSQLQPGKYSIWQFVSDCSPMPICYKGYLSIDNAVCAMIWVNWDKKVSKQVHFKNWKYTSKLQSDPISQAHERTILLFRHTVGFSHFVCKTVLRLEGLLTRAVPMSFCICVSIASWEGSLGKRSDCFKIIMVQNR